MVQRIFSVKYISVNNSFCYLSSNSLREFEVGKCFRLSYGNNQNTFLSVAPKALDVSDTFIGISSLLGKLMGINEDDNVLVSETSNFSSVKSLTICPLEKDDFLVLELLAETLQSTMLDQIKVVSLNLKFILWIGNIHVAVEVVEMDTLEVGFLDNLTEVVIKPNLALKRRSENHENNGNGDVSKMENIGKSKGALEYSTAKEQLVLRAIPVTKSKFPIPESYFHQFNVFIYKHSVPENWCDLNTVSNTAICSLTIMNCPNSEIEEKMIYVRLYILEDFSGLDYSGFENLFMHSIFIHDSFFTIFECEIGGRIRLQPVFKFPSISKIIIPSLPSHKDSIEDLLKEDLSEHCVKGPVVLNGGVPTHLNKNGICCLLEFEPTEALFCLVSSDFLREVRFVVSDVPFSKRFLEIQPKSNCSLCFDVSNYKDIVQECSESLKTSLVRKRHIVNTLIIGKEGTGKSSLLTEIKKQLSTYPFYLHCETINSTKLKRKTIKSLQIKFQNVFAQLMFYQPSVLLIDDLHILCGKVNTEEARIDSATYYNRVSEMLCDIFTSYGNNHLIYIVATTNSTESLNSSIYSSRGSHLFLNKYFVDDLNKTDRERTLKHFLEKFNIEDIDFDNLAIKTDGFVVKDFVNFAKKAVFEAIKKDSQNGAVTINQSNCELALEKTCATALQNVNFHDPGDKGFSDIGGLDDVKNVIKESFLWPVKYHNIFANAPLRLQTGLLLYGAPGTGKTILAGAAAKECDIRLISVKGPELISKYIGASEKAVRDIFEKAYSARPCILFFDEFDSLAPRRGHDNSGVTDRVVNQFLTQLDGVESLAGVCVLAATSRPDLIDPALLRPGRLDRQMLCPLPDKASRLAILKIMSKSTHFNENVDLESIASKTEGFSGADLHLLLYTAQMSTIPDNWEEEEEISFKEVDQNILEQAFEKTRPSLSQQERLKFERIYAEFEGKSSLPLTNRGTKATLA